jgi:hypothetical protein
MPIAKFDQDKDIKSKILLSQGFMYETVGALALNSKSYQIS